MYDASKSSLYRWQIGLCSVLLSVALAGCLNPEAAEDEPPESEAVYFEPIGRGQSAAFMEVTEVVVRDSAQWAALRERLHPPEPFKPVDFSQVMVLLAAVPMSSGGNDLFFESVETTGEIHIASYVLGIPGDDCRVIDGLTVPFQAVIVPQMDGPFEFVHDRELYPCSLR